MKYAMARASVCFCGQVSSNYNQICQSFVNGISLRVKKNLKDVDEYMFTCIYIWHESQIIDKIIKMNTTQ